MRYIHISVKFNRNFIQAQCHMVCKVNYPVCKLFNSYSMAYPKRYWMQPKNLTATSRQLQQKMSNHVGLANTPPWSKPLKGALVQEYKSICLFHTSSKNINLQICQLFPGKIFYFSSTEWLCQWDRNLLLAFSCQQAKTYRKGDREGGAQPPMESSRSCQEGSAPSPLFNSLVKITY